MGGRLCCLGAASSLDPNRLDRNGMVCVWGGSFCVCVMCCGVVWCDVSFSHLFVFGLCSVCLSVCHLFVFNKKVFAEYRLCSLCGFSSCLFVFVFVFV